jgi:methylated-DNA-[protein]-cysteine S-methyltransferase
MQVSTLKTVQWFAPEGHSFRWGAVFPTALGWMGIVWDDDAVQQSTFGHAHAADARRALGIAPGAPRADWRPLASDDAAAPTKLARRSLPARALVQLVERLRRFAERYDEDFTDVRLATDQHTDFQRRVLAACRSIPPGQTLTYRELATLAGSPNSARAVGNVMASNRFAPIVPCHRVVGSGGGLGGYSAPTGLTLKKRLLEAEARQAGESPRRPR